MPSLQVSQLQAVPEQKEPAHRRKELGTVTRVDDNLIRAWQMVSQGLYWDNGAPSLESMGHPCSSQC